jgi:hypothetical protein
MKPRKCFAAADCSKCGCYAGAMGTPLGSFSQIFQLVKLSADIFRKKLLK